MGRGIVVNVGDKTAMGRIASLASGLDSGLTPMAREIAEFVHLVSFIAIGTGAIIFTIAMVLGYSWLNSVIFLIGVVMSYVPEGLVATIAVYIQYIQLICLLLLHSVESIIVKCFPPDGIMSSRL